MSHRKPHRAFSPPKHTTRSEAQVYNLQFLRFLFQLPKVIYLLPLRMQSSVQGNSYAHGWDAKPQTGSLSSHVVWSSHLESLPAHGSMHSAVLHGVNVPYRVESDTIIICGFCTIPSWDAE